MDSSKTKRHRRNHESKKKDGLKGEVCKAVECELTKNEKEFQQRYNVQSKISNNHSRVPSLPVNRRKNKAINATKTIAERTNSSIKQLNNRSKNEQANDESSEKYIKNSDRLRKGRLIKKLSQKMSTMNIAHSEADNNRYQLSGTNIPKEYTFPKTINRDHMREILRSKKKNSQQYFIGTLRFNQKMPKYSYVTIENGNEDIMINGNCDRNRALEKDVVAIRIHPQDMWFKKYDGTCQKTAVVVSIIEKVHSRKSIGTLLPYKEGFRFYSKDRRFPLLIIDAKSLPEDCKNDEKLKKRLFIGKMLDWSSPSYCSGKIIGEIGNVGDLEAENKAILIENDLDVSPYDKRLIKDLPTPDYIINEEDLIGREDWRDECVFTIDPATAVDLDDAISCRKLANGNFQVGVHIADVTYFLKASSPLDKLVSKRATTIYLTNTVYHMLPKSLCQLCSLLPGQDRLTFSVIWEMTPMGEIITHRFTRSIINSSFQMSYQQAQKIIDKPNFEWSESDFPYIKNDFSIFDIGKVVNDMYAISKWLRSKRFEDGALSINQPKIQIILDEVTKLPISYCIEERLESNKLIEEFMLLANMTVAKHIYDKFPKTALLRHHHPPKPQSLIKSLAPLKNYGVHLDVTSAGKLRASMSKYGPSAHNEKDWTESKFVAYCTSMVINSLCAQTMVRANYVCSGILKNKALLKHYALNVPYYTHFTSPIRRYADCIVHRILAYSIEENVSLPHNWSTELCASLAKNCNNMKDSAKNAQEKSNELYFTYLLAERGPAECLAIVMNVRQYSLDVILYKVGFTLKLELNNIEKYAVVEYNNEDSIETVKVRWKEQKIVQVINVFSILNVRIRKHPKFYYIQANLIPPSTNH